MASIRRTLERRKDPLVKSLSWMDEPKVRLKPALGLVYNWMVLGTREGSLERQFRFL